MDPKQRVVVTIPIPELWDDLGALPLKRQRDLGISQIRDLLRLGSVQFVVARVGLALEWIPIEDCHQFWKNDAKLRLVDPVLAESGFRIEDYPGGRCYLASLWNSGAPATVLLEEYH